MGQDQVINKPPLAAVAFNGIADACISNDIT